MDVDPEALVTLVDYAYTARVEVNEDNVQTLLQVDYILIYDILHFNCNLLLQAANLLQLVDVTDACCQFLHSQLHPSNCLGIRQERHFCQEAAKLYYIIENIHIIRVNIY